MKISKIHIRAEMVPFKSGNQIAFGSIVIDEAIIVENVRLMKNPKTEKIYISWPSVKKKDGFDNMCYINDAECRKICLEEVVKAAAYANTRSISPSIKAHVTKIDDKELLGLATVEYGFITIKNIRIRKGKEGLTITFPSKMIQGVHKEVCHPLCKDVRNQIKEVVLDAFKRQ